MIYKVPFLIRLLTALLVGVAGFVCIVAAVTQQDNATILGQVVDAVSGRRIPAASIAVAIDGIRLGRFRTVTDAQGRFAIEVAPGQLELWANKPGYVDGGLGQQAPTGPFATLKVSSRQRVQDITIRLWPRSVIHGRVLDEHAEPMVDVEVLALEETWEFDRPAWVRSGVQVARTNDQGVYRLTNVPPGSYIVAVPSSDVSYSSTTLSAASSSYPTIFYPSFTDPATASRVVLGAGEDRALGDIVITAPVETAAVRGQILGEFKEGRSEVELVPAQQTVWTDVDIRRTTVAADGTFVFPHVPHGQYRVRAMSMLGSSNVFMAGGARVWIPVPPTYNRQTQQSVNQIVWGDETLDVDEKGAVVTVQLKPGLRIQGRLSFQGVSPKPATNVIVAVPLFVVPTDGRRLRTLPTTNLDADSAFRTPDLAPGTYALDIGSGYFPGWRVESISVGSDKLDNGRITLQNADVKDVSIQFTDRLSIVEGTVHDRSAKPAAGTTVIIVPADRRRWAQFSTSISTLRATLSDAEGVYRFAGLLPGEYLVTTVSSGLPISWKNPVYLEEQLREASPVRTTSGQPVRLNLRTTKDVSR
jgi:protocatechuate 3,4-dioxygenase beta subunit